MQPFYILCFVAAFSLFLWQSVSDARQSVVQQTMLLVIIISNGGYTALAGAENLREAVLATKILYTGACFLPMLYFITMCEVCCVHLNRFLLAGMTLVQTLLFGFVCTIGHNNLFHKAIVWIGANATVCGGVTIGAGSVVTHDIPSGVIAAGVPCKVIRPITEKDKIKPEDILF